MILVILSVVILAKKAENKYYKALVNEKHVNENGAMCVRNPQGFIQSFCPDPNGSYGPGGSGWKLMTNYDNAKDCIKASTC